MRKLAAILVKGDGVPADPSKAEALLQQAIAAGDVKSSADELGDLYRADTPLKDAGKAVAAYQQAVDAGNTGAMRKLAAILSKGEGLSRRIRPRAEALLKQAIAAGDVTWGAYALGDLYRADTPLKDAAKAVAAYQQAVDAGNTSAMRKLAGILTKGDGVPPIRRGPRPCSSKRSPPAMLFGVRMAGRSLSADTPLKDAAKAVAAYQQAVDAGNTGAIFNLASLLTNGKGGSLDLKRAGSLLESALAGERSNDAAFALGGLYARADFSERSIAKARRVLRTGGQGRQHLSASRISEARELQHQGPESCRRRGGSRKAGCENSWRRACLGHDAEFTGELADRDCSAGARRRGRDRCCDWSAGQADRSRNRRFLRQEQSCGMQSEVHYARFVAGRHLRF